MQRVNGLLVGLCAALLVVFSVVVLQSNGPEADAAGPGSADDAASSTPESMAGKPNFEITKLSAGQRPPQFIIFSFDGAGSISKWQTFSAAAEKVNAQFVGFLTGTYLIPDETKTNYVGPGHAPGKSSVGFGGTAQEVAATVEALNAAKHAGHEIGTHFNGHFCAGAPPSGQDWDTAQWNDELSQFFTFVADYKALGNVPGPALEVTAEDIKGGRTPCLEGKPAVYFPAMIQHGMTYDTSQISNGIVWPSQLEGMWEFWMPTVRVPALNSTVVAMDYNFWYKFNKAKDAPGQAAQFTEMVLQTYQSMYQAAMAGNRAPLVIGNHFNNWSGNAFNPAIEQFMLDVCDNPETVCTTYQNVIKWMDAQDPTILAELLAQPPTYN